MITDRLSASGIIMAGGKSTRMGCDKGALVLQGKTLADRTIDSIVGLFMDTIYVTNRPSEVDRNDVIVATDEIPYLGPLGGLAAGLRLSNNEANFVVAFDMPFINKKLIAYMVSLSDEADIIVPKIGGGYEPLFAVYSSDCLKHIDRRIADGDRRLISFYDDVKVKEIGVEEIKSFDKELRTFININTLDDYGKVKEILKESGQ